MDVDPGSRQLREEFFDMRPAELAGRQAYAMHDDQVWLVPDRAV